MSLLKKHKRQIILALLMVLVLMVIGFIFLGILFATGVITIDGGSLNLNVDIFNSLADTWWLYIVFLLLQIAVTTLLSFVPATSMMFIFGGIALFGANYKCFLICFAGVIISSVMMDLIGRFGGSKLIIKLIGEEEYNKAHVLVQEKGEVYLPLMYLFPIFPDDAICMIAGMGKIKFWLHLIYIVLCRGIGVATIVFGITLIPFSEFTTFYDWIIFGAIAIVYLTVLFKFARFVDNKLTAYRQNKTKKNNEEENLKVD